MAITIRSVSFNTNDGSTATASVTTPTGANQAQTGDLVLVWHGNDFYTTATMPTPTATGSPTLTTAVDVDAGSNQAHIRTYTYVVNTGGAQTISVTETGTHDEEKWIGAIVFAGADTTTPLDGTNTAFSTATQSSQVAAAITPGNADTLMVIINNAGGSTHSTSYTEPGSMTEQVDTVWGATCSGVVATEQLAASGSTGTRTITAALGCTWAAVTIGIRTAAVSATATAAAPLTVVGGRRPGPAGTSLILGSTAASRDFQQPVDVIGAPPRAPGGVGSAIVVSSQAPSRDAQPATLLAGTAPRPPVTGSALVLASRSIPPPVVDTPPPASVVAAGYRPYPSPGIVVLGSAAPSRDAQPASVVAAAAPARVLGSALAVTSRADPVATVDTAPPPAVVGTLRPPGPGSVLVASSAAASLDAQPAPVQTAAASVQVRRGGALVLGSAADPVAATPPAAALSTTIVLARPGTATAPRFTADPPPPTLPLAVLAPAALLLGRPGAVALSRGPVPPFVAPPGTPTASLIVTPVTVWRIVRAPLVYSAAPCACVTPRPSTGTVGRPSTGAVARPDTGIVKDPCC